MAAELMWTEACGAWGGGGSPLGSPTGDWTWESGGGGWTTESSTSAVTGIECEWVRWVKAVLASGIPL